MVLPSPPAINEIYNILLRYDHDSTKLLNKYKPTTARDKQIKWNTGTTSYVAIE